MRAIVTLLSLGLLPAVLAFTKIAQKIITTERPPEKLSQFGFFEGPTSELRPAAHVVPYTLASPLFSNYAEKSRFIVFPSGKKAIYHADDAFELPQGTYLIKTFYMPHDLRNVEGNRRLLETRIMYKDADGWQTWPYVWNEAQNDAFYDPAGETLPVEYINLQGKKTKTDYLIPNKNQCKGCHSSHGEIVPIGIAARHLNRDYTFANGIYNQLDYWAKEGYLQGLPLDKQNVAANAIWNDPKYTTESRARAYLDINCGYCHRPQGAANTSGLFLYAQETNNTALGIMKTPVAAGRGSGGHRFDVVPGKPDASILLYRMQTNDPGIAMPELGREQVHAEGVALIREWIKKMPMP